ncbi:MAG: GNAT family N-acetyltransferase [Bacillota bacterium]|nr:GNAT family N-acetyltransferase [Bacillota bacterium]
MTEEVEGGFIISNDRTRLNTERICYLLSKTYWADKRSEDKIELSIQNSICYGVYKNDLQIGFARVVTDFATMFWLGDVVIDEEYRDKGLGKKLVDLIVNSEELQGLKGFLSTKNAHGLYEKYGFVRSGDIFMSRN